MDKRILQILDNVRYWDTCPDDYKKDIETFLNAQSTDLRIYDVSGRSEQLVAILKTVKGITIPDTDEGVEAMVKQYSN